MDDKRKVDLEWYNDGSIIINLIIGLIILIIILSQSFAVNHNLSTYDIFRDILNHNSLYLIVVVYFILLKTSFGKKYFNFINIFFIIFYLITSITSLLTLLQSFTLISIISFGLHIVLFMFLFHSLLKDTRVWKDYKLNKSPFNELNADNYFYCIMILSMIFLAINLIEATTIDGAILSCFDSIYYILVARYVYLYSVFLDNKYNKKEEDK